MKTIAAMHPLPHRILNGIIALFCLVSAPVSYAASVPIGQVAVKLAGEELGNRKKINVDSGSKRIEASQSYDYDFKARVRGKRGTPAANIINGSIDLATLLDAVSPGSSALLKGTISNPSGTLPATIFDRKISGRRNVPGLGRVKFSIKVKGEIDANGVCHLSLTKMKIKSSQMSDVGSFEYMKGSKLTLSAAPTVTFIRTATTLPETSGSVTIKVRRYTNLHGAVSVDYTTVPGTATSSDFTPTSGTLNFADRENEKTIVIPLIDNSLNDGVRRFTVELSNPSANAFLGSMVTTKVVITDDE